MRFIKIIVSLLFFVTILNVKAVYAADPTPIPTSISEALRPTCGFADTPNANMCCPKVDIEKKVLSPARDILRGVLFDFIADDIVNTIGLVYEIDPVARQLQIDCYTGLAEVQQVKNPTTGQLEDGPCLCSSKAFQKPLVQSSSGASPATAIEKICDKYISNRKERDACLNCAKRDGFMTGLGCIPTDIGGFVTDFLLTLGIGLAGLFSLGCIIYSAVMIQTSQGNAEKISQSQDQIKACILGLLMIIFSIFILRVVGVDILQIPGFG